MKTKEQIEHNEEIACLVDDIQFKASLLKIAEKALEDIRKIVTDAQAKIEAENMDSTMYEIDFKDGQLYCQSGRNDLYETLEIFNKMNKYYGQDCTVTHWKQYTLESGGFVTSRMKVRDAIWQMKERWIEKATFEIDT